MVISYEYSVDDNDYPLPPRVYGHIIRLRPCVMMSTPTLSPPPVARVRSFAGMVLQLVVASPPKAGSQADKLGVKKGDLILSINELDAVNMDSFAVTDYLAKYQVRAYSILYVFFGTVCVNTIELRAGDVHVLFSFFRNCSGILSMFFVHVYTKLNVRTRCYSMPWPLSVYFVRSI